MADMRRPESLDSSATPRIVLKAITKPHSAPPQLRKHTSRDLSYPFLSSSWCWNFERWILDTGAEQWSGVYHCPKCGEKTVVDLQQFVDPDPRVFANAVFQRSRMDREVVERADPRRAPRQVAPQTTVHLSRPPVKATPKARYIGGPALPNFSPNLKNINRLLDDRQAVRQQRQIALTEAVTLIGNVVMSKLELGHLSEIKQRRRKTANASPQSQVAWKQIAELQSNNIGISTTEYEKIENNGPRIPQGQIPL